MPRRTRPLKTSRSEHWLRLAVNERTSQLDAAIRETFGWSRNERIQWLSPVKDDGFAEYYDQQFLDRLGLANLRVPLDSFWPAGGPRWDGLARTDSGKVILVEAKAYIEEMVDYRSKASPASLRRIKESLETVKKASRATVDAPWDTPLFQFANRIAHLHYLAHMNKVDAYLLFLSFADAPDVPVPTTSEQWYGAHRLAWKCMGLGSKAFPGRVGHCVASVSELLANRALTPRR